VKYDRARALELLRIGTQREDAEFREGQEDAIRVIVEGRGRLLVVQRTGWGKSFVYFIATKLLREDGQGPALLISPLLALMRNQMLAAERMGVCAKTINSDNPDEWAQVEDAIRRNEVDILLISPERLANERFVNEVLGPVSVRVPLLVVDEAHCISDWGHDFRPHYRMLERIIGSLPQKLRLLATTATANNRVMDDLRAILGPELMVLRGDLSRPSLTLQSIRLPGRAERLAWLAEHVSSFPTHGIIYTLTVHDAELVTDWLKSRGLAVESYTSRTGDDRSAREQALLENRVKALVATVALGMGFDKPDLGFVVHFQTPGSVVAYYQQVGRAGRALDSAYGVLLSGNEDIAITNSFIENAFPTLDEVADILGVLGEAPDGLTVSELMTQLNVSRGSIAKTLVLLSLESPTPVVHLGSKWQLTAANLSQEFWDRAKRLTVLRHEEQQQMQEYVKLKRGHMEFLIAALDGGQVSRVSSALPQLNTSVNAALLEAAVEFLRTYSLTIEPRMQWPASGFRLSGRIAVDRRAERGKALCMWGDERWGVLVRQGKYQDGSFGDELVEASARLVQDWSLEPPVAWVTCVPSLRHPTLVLDFARRVADRLGLPFKEVLTKTVNRPEQKTMRNSNQQVLNVDGALGVDADALPSGPVLLIDDMVDSRWTITVAAALLRSSGGGPVFPFALALAGQGE
jgi:ATP-dependent DNA helicase RecQ